LIGGLQASELVSSDRFLFKILDRAITLQDISYQARNLKALNCIYSDALVVSYFEKSFMTELDHFLSKFPNADEEVIKYLHENAEILKKIRYFFKMLRYSEDQNKKTELKMIVIIIYASQKVNLTMMVA
jgi:hypothetical protein